jgi:hypothetical protein
MRRWLRAEEDWDMCQQLCGNDAVHAALHAIDRRRLLGGAAATAAVLTVGACTTVNPDTGREQFIIIDEAQLQQASLQAWAQMRQQVPQWRNATAQRRVETVGRRVVQAAGRGNQNWEFVLFDSPQKNAFVLPGGQVGFYRGLYDIWSATIGSRRCLATKLDTSSAATLPSATAAIWRPRSASKWSARRSTASSQWPHSVWGRRLA